jgi:hypothetical protein
MSTYAKGIDKRLRVIAAMGNSSLPLQQPTGIFRSRDRMTFSVGSMECPGKSSRFHFSAPRHHLHRCHIVFASRYQTLRSLRLPGPVNQVDAVLFCFPKGSFPLAQFWPYDIENCERVTANFCEQYQPISYNVPGLVALRSDQ